jgi:hypothetical protein
VYENTCIVESVYVHTKRPLLMFRKYFEQVFIIFSILGD